MYDWGIYKSVTFKTPVVTVGNLSVGGTGKSPFILFLVKLLLPQKKIAVLSRGYKRETKGFQFVESHSRVQDVGDEPLQLKKKFADVTVAVDANRKNGIQQLKKSVAELDAILLDDAFQHRKVKAGLQILLTPYYKLYTEDYLLPAGDLREPRSAAKRADVIVITKCPVSISDQEKQKIRERLKPEFRQQVYFTAIKYAENVFSKSSKQSLHSFLEEEFCLVTGIANPKPLVDFLKKEGANFTHKNFSDHHAFSQKEINELGNQSLLLTTEKDYMRLENYNELAEKLFYLPIEIQFLENENSFKEIILNFIS